LPIQQNGNIWIENNQGSSACNRSLATNKGWSIDKGEWYDDDEGV
jgi:hypothetical protein